MSRPAVVFVRNGLISLAAGLTVWALPYLLRDKPPETSDTPPFAKDTGPEQADILEELNVAEPQRQPVAPQETFIARPAEPAPKKADIAPPDTRPRDRVAAVLAPRQEPPDDPQSAVPASVRLEKALEEVFLPRPAPLPPAHAAVPAAPPPPVTATIPAPLPPVTAAVVAPPAPAPVTNVAPPTEPEIDNFTVASTEPPPVPDRHPHRMASLEETPPPPQEEPLIRPLSAQPAARTTFVSGGGLALLRNLWGGDNLAGPRPAQAADTLPEAASPVSSAVPGAATGMQESAARSSSPNVATDAQWKPFACDDSKQFWKR